MGRDRDSAQDQEMIRMEKILKHDKSNTCHRIHRSQDELKALYEKSLTMTPAEKLIAMPWDDWAYSLQLELRTNKKVRLPGRIISIIWVKNKPKFEEFHKKGTAFSEVIRWMEDEGDNHSGW
jgi:hypothetical protein